ncbi:MAG: hypothetical protein ABJM43_00070 [Paracoccaceae bacterium]
MALNTTINRLETRLVACDPREIPDRFANFLDPVERHSDETSKDFATAMFVI